MKISITYLVLLTAWVYEVAARGLLHTSRPATVSSHGEDLTLTPLNNYNGWVNPEDLTSMPQCIAQQNQSTWLRTMTECTSKRCTSHFGFICTHHQWLTDLSCLSIGFSPDIIEGYLPYCGRSVLAKAQLYRWVHNITGRTWLVDVGDANGLEDLSPNSLAEGYATFDVTYNAPTCLTSSVSSLSMEPFQHAMASCSFTGTTQHTGNAARPWEYSESLQSMIALDSETVGYSLISNNVGYGHYFDIECFCSAFTIDSKKEPCSESGQIDLTKERLWVNATCGSTSLPDNWTDILETTEFAAIPMEDWHWPMCVADMPKQVTELTNKCATDACELDSSGYCKDKRAVDRACFCHGISYDSCGGSCHIFETRIDYIKWLHGICGDVQDWHGLPDNWRQLTAPTVLDIIPWRWTLKPSNDSIIAHTTRLRSIRTTETCASKDWKLGSIALVNIAAVLTAFLSQKTSMQPIARRFLWHLHSWNWFFKGTLIATLQLLATWLTVFLVQKTPGYEDVPFIELMLLWSSMPRLTWLPVLLIGVQPFDSIGFSAVASSLFAEIILTCFSSYYIVMTINYGWEHNFYLGGLENAQRRGPAKMMYAGALMWLIVIILAFVQVMRTTRKNNRLTRSGSSDLLAWQRSKQATSNMAEELMAQFNERCTRLSKQLTHYWMYGRPGSDETPLRSNEGRGCMVYGTFSMEGQIKWASQIASVELYAATIIGMLLLWISQWLFWAGFIGLSSEEYVLPQ
ncbi:hypothetical protein FQN54_003205 [Arachnomyces sp. PD_36]|nr:hypothetical protein FQN54_003205 [Arachnomyces sp. PD_36]